MELHLLKYRPAYKHWYLFNIGVLEEYRSRGIGSQLLDYGTERIGDYPAYLEASTYDSARLYERRGFFSSRSTASSPRRTPSAWSTLEPTEIVQRNS